MRTERALNVTLSVFIAMYETILVATDGSGPANRAVTHALEQAKQHGAELCAIHVVDTHYFPEPALSSTELKTIAIEDWGREQLEKVKERGEELGLSVEIECFHGKPWQEIIKYGDEIDADAIVIGYQGHSHTQTDKMGTVTDRVVQNAGRPVLVV